MAYVCAFCKQAFPERYTFRRDGTLNPLSAASAKNNFRSHETTCARKTAAVAGQPLHVVREHLRKRWGYKFKGDRGCA